MDVIGDVSNEFVIENGLELGSTIHQKISEVKYFDLFESQSEITYIPGGCQFNAMRVFNWLIDHKDDDDNMGFLGSVGADMYGDIYMDMLQKEKIEPIFETIENATTGICLVMVNNRDRAHITDLGASTIISKEFVDRMWKRFANVKLIYTELFIIKHQKEITYMLAKLG